MLQKLASASDVKREIFELAASYEAVEDAHASECCFDKRDVQRLPDDTREAESNIGSVLCAGYQALRRELAS